MLPPDLERAMERLTPAWDIESTRRSRVESPTADASTALMHESLGVLVKLLEQVAPGMRGSILLLDEDGKTLRHGAAPSLPPDYCREIDGSMIGPAAGSCGTAACRRERVVVRDISRDPLWDDYRDIATAHGLAACWSTPIIDGDANVIGTFAMYYDEPRDPTPSDIALTETATLLARNIIKRARMAATLEQRTEVAERLVMALHASESKFRQMTETIPVQVWTASPDGLLDFVTTRTAAFFGRPAAELIGDGWTRIVHPEDLDRASSTWQHSLDTGESYEVEFRTMSADGSYHWHLVRAEPIRDETGRIRQWFGCTADIEQQKQLEKDLDSALEAARAANKSKSDFLAVMSHELRTPLNAIAGYTQLMLDGIPTPATEPQQDYLRRIARSQEHLLNLIETVLTHAKVEAGKITYDIDDVLLYDILDTVDPLTAPQRAAKGISYECESCDGSLVLRADRKKVVQILLNLLSNAFKFTPEGGRVSMSTNLETPGAIAISVTDTGIGMAPDQVGIVFEPFVQFDSSLSRDQPGAGLGMPISRDLARGMGGDLVAASEIGVGSTFTLTLPLASK